MASTYELIETTTLASSASSVTFSSITQDYRDLVLVVSAPDAGFFANGIVVRFNGDTGTNYYRVNMTSNGSSRNSSSGSGESITVGIRGDATSTIGISQVMDYSATDKHKTVLVRSNTAQYLVEAIAARWANTSAITSLEFKVSNSSDFAVGTSFQMYGIAA